MIIRSALKDDLEAVNFILSVSFNRIYAHFARLSFSTLENALVSEEEKKITGAINYRIFEMSNQKIGYLYYMAVHPEHRRKGIGKKLILQAVENMRKTGLTEIYAAVEKKNKPSRELIKAIGFVSIDRSALKEKYGRQSKELYSKMNLMPWEDLFILEGK